MMKIDKNIVIQECIDIVKSHIQDNCNDHTPFRGACISCGQYDNPDVIKNPDVLLEELNDLKNKNDVY